MRNILAILVDRANYGRMKPVLSAIQNDPDLKLDIMCTGTMVLPRFGNVVDEVVRDGFPVSSRVYMEIEGSNTTTMSKSIGLGIVQFSTEFERISPDFILAHWRPIRGPGSSDLGSLYESPYSAHSGW